MTIVVGITTFIFSMTKTAPFSARTRCVVPVNVEDVVPVKSTGGYSPFALSTETTPTDVDDVPTVPVT